MEYVPDMQVSVKQLRAARADGHQRAAMPTLPPGMTQIDLDPAVFGALRGMLPTDVLAHTYREFLKRTRAQLVAFSAADDPSRANERGDLGHTIRGTAGMLGATQVAVCAAALERTKVTASELRTAVTSLHTACTALESALRKEQVQL